MKTTENFKGMTILTICLELNLSMASLMIWKGNKFTVLGNHKYDKKRRCWFRTVVSAVSFVVGNPVLLSNINWRFENQFDQFLNIYFYPSKNFFLLTITNCKISILTEELRWIEAK